MAQATTAVLAESQAEAAAAEAVVAVVLEGQVDAAKSGCGFTNERHNKNKSSWRQRTGWASYAL